MDETTRDQFDRFFDEHYVEVVRALALVVGDRGRAEDAAQEAFAQAYRRWSRVSVMERPVGWVMVVGVNRLKRDLARAARTHEDRRTSHRSVAPGSVPMTGSSESSELSEASRADHADQVVERASLRVALDRLAPRQRATVVLRYLCDLSTEQVAEALRCSPGTVKSALSAGLANLRVELGPVEGSADGPAEEPSESAASGAGADGPDPHGGLRPYVEQEGDDRGR